MFMLARVTLSTKVNLKSHVELGARARRPEEIRNSGPTAEIRIYIRQCP